jgi:hypothetical protein
MFRLERLAEQWVVEEIDLSDGDVVRGAPVRIDQSKLVAGQRRGSAPR